MKKKVLTVLILVGILASSLILFGPSNLLQMNKDKKEDILASQNIIPMKAGDKKAYISSAEQASSNISDEVKKRDTEYNLIYNSIMASEGNSIMKEIKISDKDIEDFVKNKSTAQLVKIIDVTDPSDETVSTYYVYEGDQMAEASVEDLQNMFKDKKIEVKDADENARKEEAKRTLSSDILVKIIEQRTEECLGKQD